MPLYEYTCGTCGFEFEELVGGSEDKVVQKCKKCGKEAKTKMSSFSSVVQGSSNESIDSFIGKESNRRWSIHEDRKSERRKNKDFQEIKDPIQGAPVMTMGNKDEKVKRKEYSSALQDHRKDRKGKGQTQFTEPGSF